MILTSFPSRCVETSAALLFILVSRKMISEVRGTEARRNPSFRICQLGCRCRSLRYPLSKYRISAAQTNFARISTIQDANTYYTHPQRGTAPVVIRVIKTERRGKSYIPVPICSPGLTVGNTLQDLLLGQCHAYRRGRTSSHGC